MSSMPQTTENGNSVSDFAKKFIKRIGKMVKNGCSAEQAAKLTDIPTTKSRKRERQSPSYELCT